MKYPLVVHVQVLVLYQFIACGGESLSWALSIHCAFCSAQLGDMNGWGKHDISDYSKVLIIRLNNWYCYHTVKLMINMQFNYSLYKTKVYQCSLALTEWQKHNSHGNQSLQALHSII